MTDDTPTKDGPVTLITGASAGIGRATAELCAARGHRLVLVARREEKLREIAAGLHGTQVERVVGDVADPATAAHAVRRALDTFGRLDALVNNAGHGLFRNFVDLTPEEWRQQIDVNLLGCVHFARAALDVMLPARRGTIVNVSSVAGTMTFPTGAAYCATKFALEGMSGCLREEVRDAGVRVSLICPGSVASDFFHVSDGHFMGQDRTGDQSWMATPEEIARAILFAIECEDRSFVTRVEVRPLRKPGSSAR